MPTYRKEKPQKKATYRNLTEQASGREAPDAKCSTEKSCGGCSLLNVPYEEQLKNKQKYLEKLFAGIVKPDPIIGAKRRYYYRNKITATFGTDKKGNAILGLYEEHSHRIIEHSGCLIEDERGAKILDTIKKLVRSFKIPVYNEARGTGVLKHVQLRTSRTTGEIMAVLVCKSPVFPSKKAFADTVKKELPELTTLCLNINPKDTTMVMGNRNITLFGPGFIYDRLLGNRYRISPGSFYQINPEQTELLYGKALEFAALKSTDVVVDAYCGTGTIALAAARSGAAVTGIELNRTAVADAVRNAGENGLSKVRFISGDAGDILTEYAEKRNRVDVIFMDPPRSGSTPAFIKACAKAAPSRIVYISCEPETLVRDLLLFSRQGYKTVKAVGTDMFPQTEKIEVVTLLEKTDE